ncbi:MAG: DNA polymerase III subunit delta' [Rhodobacteraceae bacterium]|nr:DNA polymerase III subunit delta' [Paracoccaceae bacterium]
MSADEATPEADRAEGVPHPRETLALYGQGAAEAQFLDAFNSGKLHHAWLISGPRGVGKATLAWRIARFLLATPMQEEGGLFGDAPPAPETLEISPDHPVARRVAVLSEPRLLLIRRAWDADKKRLKAVITVDEVRKLRGFLGLSATDGGRRVVIVDAADELNVSAANALLKLLEEPPADTVLLLISHQPSRLLPTIRSRCRDLRCLPLSPEALSSAIVEAGVEIDADPAALADLAGGSVGEAIRLSAEGGLAIYAELAGLFAGLPDFDRQRALKLAESCAGRGAEARFDLVLTLIDLFLARLARAGAGMPPTVEACPGEADIWARLSPGPGAARHWAEVQQDLGTRARHGRAVNLDPAALILDMVLKISETAAPVAAR